MKKIMLAALFAVGAAIGLEAAPTDAVTQADLQAIIQRLNALEAQNKEQAKKIAELEGRNKELNAQVAKASAPAAAEIKDGKVVKVDEGSEISESGKIVTTSNGKKYYLADASAKIFEPLSESGLQITPYGYLVLEGVYSSRQLDADYTTDWVSRNSQKRNHTTLSVQDSIFGVQFDTPESFNGWKFSGRAEFDLVDTSTCDENHYGFHWRHLYVNAEHEASGWSILMGQTWHLWKMVTPSEIDGAWMENTGHPYRRSPQIRVTKKFNWDDSSLEIRAGILKGGPGMGEDRDGNGIQDNSANSWVLFEAAALYDHVAPWQDDGKRWLVGIGGMYGRDRSYRYGWKGSYDTKGDKEYGFGGQEDDYDSMMIMLAGSIPFGKFSLCGQIFAGQNLGGIQAGCGQTVSYHNFDNGYVQGNAIRTVGGFLDLTYEFNDQWSAALGYGFDDPIDSDVEGGSQGNNYGILWNDRMYIAAFYRVTPNLKFGLEYARLMTSYCDGHDDDGNALTSGDLDADRVQFSAFYDF